ncbi:MAG: hypothetical protein ACR2RE_18280 [Geminicoccaceae bacterium]
MKLKNHGDCVNAVREAVSKLGGVSMKYTVGMFRQMDGERLIRIGQPGVSDVIACIGGTFVGIEVKFSDGDQVSAEQDKFREVLERAGGKWVLADFRRGNDGCEAVTDLIGEAHPC